MGSHQPNGVHCVGRRCWSLIESGQRGKVVTGSGKKKTAEEIQILVHKDKLNQLTQMTPCRLAKWKKKITRRFLFHYCSRIKSYYGSVVLISCENGRRGIKFNFFFFSRQEKKKELRPL